MLDALTPEERTPEMLRLWGLAVVEKLAAEKSVPGPILALTVKNTLTDGSFDEYGEKHGISADNFLEWLLQKNILQGSQVDLERLGRIRTQIIRSALRRDGEIRNMPLLGKRQHCGYLSIVGKSKYVKSKKYPEAILTKSPIPKDKAIVHSPIGNFLGGVYLSHPDGLSWKHHWIHPTILNKCRGTGLGRAMVKIYLGVAQTDRAKLKDGHHQVVTGIASTFQALSKAGYEPHQVVEFAGDRIRLVPFEMDTHSKLLEKEQMKNRIVLRKRVL